MTTSRGIGGAAIVVAAGQSRRAGLEGNKVLFAVGGRPLVSYPVDVLLTHPRVSSVVLVLRPEDRGLWSPPPCVLVVDGGATRSDSVRAGLASVTGSGDRPVLVHDGARPLLEPGDVDRVLEALEGADGAAVGVRAFEAVKRAGPDLWIEESFDRGALWLARTPQAFRLGTLRAALGGGGDFEDCAAAVGAAGGRVRMVEGSRGNIKVTWPEDLDLVRRLLDDPPRHPIDDLGIPAEE